MAVEDLRPIDEIGQDDRGDFAVVVDQVPLRVAFLWLEDLGEVGQVQRVSRSKGCGHGYQPDQFVESMVIIRANGPLFNGLCKKAAVK